jgi:hypothetical protein
MMALAAALFDEVAAAGVPLANVTLGVVVELAEVWDKAVLVAFSANT